MDHEGREEREGVKKKEARFLIPSLSLVNAYPRKSRQNCSPLSTDLLPSDAAGVRTTW